MASPRVVVQRADELASLVAPATTPLLLATGQFPGPDGAVRVGLLRDATALVDAWVARAELEGLASALASRGPVRRGGWDVMFATSWSYAWTSDGPPLVVVGRNGALVEQRSDGSVVVHGHTFDGARIAAVEAHVSEGWETRTVRLHLDDGSSLVVAKEHDAMVALDPTYDGLSLLVDGSWARALAEAIGAALGARVVVSPLL